MDAADIKELNQHIEQKSEFTNRLDNELRKILVGQKKMVESILIAFLANGHILIEGVPGLAKTLAVFSFAKMIDAAFQRIQFTPDLLPSDIIGTMIFNSQKGAFETKKGPVFTNIILADEINRTAPKVQSALLEGMQERQVTIGETTYPLDDPFIVLATQNPIEQEGTYPLPEAQVDRFMLKTLISYPTKAEEKRIVALNTAEEEVHVNKVVDMKEIIDARELVKKIYIDEKIVNYILSFVEATRDPLKYGIKDLEGMISFGGSPRASIFLTRAAKARAFIHRRGYVTPEDVRMMLPDVLRHRMILSFEAEAEEVTPEKIISKIMESIPVP